MKILSSIILVIVFYVVISLIGAVSLRNDFIVITQPDEVICTLDPALKSQFCVELNSSTEKLKSINDKLTFSEIAYCRVFNIFSFSDLNKKCSTFSAAQDLYIEIETLRYVIETIDKNNVNFTS